MGKRLFVKNMDKPRKGSLPAVHGFSGDYKHSNDCEKFVVNLNASDDLEILRLSHTVDRTRAWVMRAALLALDEHLPKIADRSDGEGPFDTVFQVPLDMNMQRMFFKLRAYYGCKGSWLMRAAFKHYHELYEKQCKEAA